jgi:hypothetical protein
VQPSATIFPVELEISPTETLGPTDTTVPSNTPGPTTTIPPSPTQTHTPEPDLTNPTERLNVQALCLAYSYTSKHECPIQSDRLEAYNLDDIAFPEPVVLEGSGDNPRLNFYNPFDSAIVHIRGNAAGEPFTVRAVTPDSHGANLTLVNTTDPYDGVHPIDLHERQHTLRFEIKATGDWIIEILPLADAHLIDVPGSITGFGDDAILLVGEIPGSITIKANPDGHIFKINAYGSTETELVNTKDPYEGVISLPADTVLIEIGSQDDWEITIHEK